MHRLQWHRADFAWGHWPLWTIPSEFLEHESVRRPLQLFMWRRTLLFWLKFKPSFSSIWNGENIFQSTEFWNLVREELQETTKIALRQQKSLENTVFLLVTDWKNNYVSQYSSNWDLDSALDNIQLAGLRLLVVQLDNQKRMFRHISTNPYSWEKQNAFKTSLPGFERLDNMLLFKKTIFLFARNRNTKA